MGLANSSTNPHVRLMKFSVAVPRRFPCDVGAPPASRSRRRVATKADLLEPVPFIRRA